MLVEMNGGVGARTVSGLRRMRVNRCNTCSRGDEGLLSMLRNYASQNANCSVRDRPHAVPSLKYTQACIVQ